MLQRVKCEEELRTMSQEIYDIVICGGGITGAGMARDAALRGLKVALFEKADFGSGTSSKSSKLIHGGLRYLEHGEIKLVFEGTNERSLQMARAAHLVRPIPFLVPIYKHNRPGLEVMNLGLWIYDALAMFRSPKLHKTYRGKKVATLEPALNKEGLAGAIEYYDCLTDDARLVIENIIDAKAQGAEVYNYTRVTGVERNDQGRVNVVHVKDELTGVTRSVNTHFLAIAGGPWTDEILGAVGTNAERKLLRPTKGVHIVVDYNRLPVTRAITLFTKDRRTVFCLPWVERTVIGTTDTDFQGSPDEVHATLSDVQYLCDRANDFFAEAKLTPDDIISTWAGLRPLIASDASRPNDVSREHEVFVREDGVLIIAGGKLTTYRRMAKEAIDEIVKSMRAREENPLKEREITKCRTKPRQLPGAEGITPPGAKGLAALIMRYVMRDLLPERTARHLAESYGVRAEEMITKTKADESLLERLDPELPYIWAEVEFAVQNELARTLEDVLVRRIQLCLRSKDQGLGVAPRVAAKMAELLQWTPEETERQLKRYESYVAASRKFRSEPPPQAS
jgi:glycerol-3-phosphate dehydrogenase